MLCVFSESQAFTFSCSSIAELISFGAVKVARSILQELRRHDLICLVTNSNDLNDDKTIISNNLKDLVKKKKIWMKTFTRPRKKNLTLNKNVFKNKNAVCFTPFLYCWIQLEK